MQSSHNDLLLKGQVTAIKLCQTSMVVQLGQLVLQFMITANEAYRQFPFYLLLNAVTVVPHAYSLLLFARYYCSDAPLNRACLPIACSILCLTTAILIFQVTFIQLKDIGTGHQNGDLHIGVSAEYEAKYPSQQSWRPRDGAGKKNMRKPAIQPTTMEIPNAGSLLGFLAPLIALAIYWAVAYSAFNAYAQRYLPEHQRQTSTKICCFGRRSSRPSSNSSGRSQASSRQRDQRRPDNNTVIKRIIAQNQQKREQRAAQVASSSEVELGNQPYQSVNSNADFSTINTESSGSDSDRRQQDFEDDLEDNRSRGSVPGESSVANQLR